MQNNYFYKKICKRFLNLDLSETHALIKKNTRIHLILYVLFGIILFALMNLDFECIYIANYSYHRIP